jgi:DNA-binding NarL/FixJ family response regulator
VKQLNPAQTDEAHHWSHHLPTGHEPGNAHGLLATLASDDPSRKPVSARRAAGATTKLAAERDDTQPWRALGHGLQLAAMAADEQHPHPSDPSPLWKDLVVARAQFYCDWHGATRSYVVALTNGSGSGIRCPLTDSQTTVLLRVLCGEQQKFVASEMNIANSTASKRHGQALDILEINGRPAPLPLVIAAQHAAGVIQVTWARRCVFEHEGGSFTVLSVPRPQAPPESTLTASERIIAVRFIEGGSRCEIARGRSTSEQTVSCQLRAIFAKLRLTGRFAAIMRAAELGWFRG